METVLRNYVPKKKHDAIKEVSKDMDGYDVVLNEGWLFERNNTGFIAETVKELRYFMKEVEQFEKEEYDRIMVSLGNGPEKVKPEIIEIEDNDDYVDPIQVIVEVEETEEVEDEEFDFDNVSLKDHQKEMVIGLGFNQDITQEVMDGLKKRDTKVAEDVLNKIQEMFSENKYTILTDGQEVRVASIYLVTQKEKKQIKSITGMRVSDEIHDGIEWLVWLCGEEKNKY